MNSYLKDTENNRAFNWESKSINVGLGSQKKYFYQVDTVYKGKKPSLKYGTNGGSPTNDGIVTDLDSNHSKMKVNKQLKIPQISNNFCKMKHSKYQSKIFVLILTILDLEKIQKSRK